MVDPVLMERTADNLLSAIVEHDMPLDKVDMPFSCTAHALNHLQLVPAVVYPYGCKMGTKI